MWIREDVGVNPRNYFSTLRGLCIGLARDVPVERDSNIITVLLLFQINIHSLRRDYVCINSVFGSPEDGATWGIGSVQWRHHVMTRGNHSGRLDNKLPVLSKANSLCKISKMLYVLPVC